MLVYGWRASVEVNVTRYLTGRYDHEGLGGVGVPQKVLRSAGDNKKSSDNNNSRFSLFFNLDPTDLCSADLNFTQH